MKLARIYTGEDNRSHFEDLDLPGEVSAESGRTISAALAATGAAFGESPQQAPRGLHNAPRRQVVAVLSGGLEIECGDGSRRRFGSGDAFLADDLSGEGHKTRSLGALRLLYVFVADDFDPAPWRTA